MMEKDKHRLAGISSDPAAFNLGKKGDRIN